MISFSNTHYKSLVQSEITFKNDINIFNFVRSNPQFSYGSATFERYSKVYQDKGRPFKKCAVPFFLINCIFREIGQLFKAAAAGLMRWDSNRQKAEIYTSIRIAEEALGWLVALFNDRLGRYLIEEARFHNTCYRVFLGDAKLKEKSGFNEEAQEVLLSDLKEISHRDRETAFSYFGISSIPGIHDFLDTAPHALLQLINFQDLFPQFEESKLKYAMMSEEDFTALTLKEVMHEVNEGQLYFIRQRIALNEAIAFPYTIGLNIDYVPLKRLRSIDPKDLRVIYDEIPPAAFAFFTPKQLQAFKLANLKDQEIKSLVSKFHFGDPLKWDEEGCREMLQSFEEDDVARAVSRGVLNGTALRCLTLGHLRKVDLYSSNITLTSLENLFCDAEKIACFAEFSFLAVKDLLVNNPSSAYFISELISKEQLDWLKFECLPKEVLRVFLDRLTLLTEEQRALIQSCLLDSDSETDKG